MPRALPIEPRKPAAIFFLAPRRPQPQTKAAAHASATQNWPILIASLLGASVALTTLIASAFLRCRLVQSRELPLLSLGEPLAPANQEGNATLACPGVAACPVMEKASDDK